MSSLDLIILFYNFGSSLINSPSYSPICMSIGWAGLFMKGVHSGLEKRAQKWIMNDTAWPSLLAITIHETVCGDCPETSRPRTLL